MFAQARVRKPEHAGVRRLDPGSGMCLSNCKLMRLVVKFGYQEREMVTDTPYTKRLRAREGASFLLMREERSASKSHMHIRQRWPLVTFGASPALRPPSVGERQGGTSPYPKEGIRWGRKLYSLSQQSWQQSWGRKLYNLSQRSPSQRNPLGA